MRYKTSPLVHLHVMTQDYLMEIPVPDTGNGIRTPVCWRDGEWFTFGESVDSRFISLPDMPAIVLENVYRRAHATCLTMSCWRGMFDIYSHFIGTAEACPPPGTEPGESASQSTANTHGRRVVPRCLSLSLRKLMSRLKWSKRCLDV